MVAFEIYTEGGGYKLLNSSLIAAFQTFFKKYGVVKSPRIVMCGGRENAYKQFVNAIKIAKHDKIPLLLVDSEQPFHSSLEFDYPKWEFLRKMDSWSRPNSASEDSVFLMVQCMESWFLADREMLKKFYGQEFIINALPGNHNIEEIDKDDVFKALDNATRNTQKRKYEKGRHSPELLKLLDPKLVTSASRCAKEFLDRLAHQQNP